jgi:ABC-2 type transport system permease protein
VLGGLVLPLDAYPEALAVVAWLTPFPAMLHTPASITLDASLGHAAPLLAVQIAWLGAAWVAVAAAGRAFERRLVRAGACA